MKMLSIMGLLALCTPALCEENVLRLHTVEDFLNFANSVNSGNNYKKSTVFLENTLDFSSYTGDFAPIGNKAENAFAGVFDGQGFAIGHLNIKTKDRYGGLFGYTKGATVKSIVISMTNVVNVIGDASTPANSKIYAGGVVGYCEKVGGYCKVENSVNIANVTYTGSAETSDVYLGGITGYIYSRYTSHVKNCANYGLVASYGESKSIVIGGIIGHYAGTSTTLTVSNCLNLGPIYFKSSNAESWMVGGLAGNSEYCAFDNCVSGAKILSTEVDSKTIGILSGRSTQTTFKNCYWSDGTWSVAPGTKTEECAAYNSEYKLKKKIVVGNYTGDVLLDVLNNAVKYYVLYEFSNWGFSTKRLGMDFTINDRSKHFDMENQLFLLPGPSNEGLMTFDGWYSDKAYTQPLTNFIFTEDSEVFGRWKENKNNYTISFDVRGGTPAAPPMSGQFGTDIYLPSDITKGECMLGWWENDYGDQMDWEFTVPAHDITLHAVWGCTYIESASDLIGMAKIVNSGTSYKSVIVSLENDIVFTEEESSQFVPIGKNNYMSYEGIFDGHGYTISGLKLKTSFGSTGLLGYSRGAIVRNVVMDSTCSIISTYGTGTGDDESFFGSLMGYCETHNDNCIMENNVNMADVIFDGDSSTNIFIGGFAGYLMTTQGYMSKAINCVNYGAVKHTGNSRTYADVGGIAGGVNGGEKGAYIHNCMNYGVVLHSGESNTPSIGGIVGYSTNRTRYENCVSIGMIDTNKESSCIGAIAGETYTESTVNNCYWGTNTREDIVGIIDSTTKIENSASFDTNNFELSSKISAGTYTGNSLIKALNSLGASNVSTTYSKWALNKNNHTITFMIRNRTAPFVVFDSQIIVLPNLTNCHEEKFHGWYVNSDNTGDFVATEFTKDTTLYGRYEYVPPIKPKSSSSVNPGVVVLIIFIVLAVLIMVGFVLWNKFHYERKSDKEIQELIEPMLLEKPGNSIDMLALYPEDYVTPNMKTALINAGIDESRAESITSKCYRHANELMEAKKLPKGVTVDDAAAITLYTMEDNNLDKNPYKMINDALGKGELDALIPVKGMLYLVMHALRKMPIVHNKPLYRGVPKRVLNANGADVQCNRNVFCKGGESFEEDYLEGEETMWPALSSTITGGTTTKAFLSRESETGKAEGIIFIVENGWGYNIQSCSMFPGDEEIVLEPERRFRVKSIASNDGLTAIKIEMLRTPIVLPDVFGEVNSK